MRGEQEQTRPLTLHLQVHLAHLREAVPQVHGKLLNHCQRKSPSEGRGQRRKYVLRHCVRACVRASVGWGSREPATLSEAASYREKETSPASPSLPAIPPARPLALSPARGSHGRPRPAPPTHFLDSPLGTTSRPLALGGRGDPGVYLCHSLSPEFCPFQYGASASSARSASVGKKKEKGEKKTTLAPDGACLTAARGCHWLAGAVT